MATAEDSLFARLEWAVAAQLQQHIPIQEKQDALIFCQEIMKDENGWIICMKRLTKDPQPLTEVTFFCFTVIANMLLHQYETQSQVRPEEMVILRNTLLNWMKNSQNRTDYPSSLKNKFAQVVILLFSHTFLSTWPDFFDNMFSIISCGDPIVLDVYLRILYDLDSLVLSREASRSAGELAHSNMIKDKMRVSCVSRLADVWYSIILRFYQANAHLARSCMISMEKYISWIPIELVANNRIHELLVKLLDFPVLRESSCDCYRAMILKGMDWSNKVNLIGRLDILNIIRLHSNSQTMQQSVIVADNQQAMRFHDRCMNVSGVKYSSSDEEILYFAVALADLLVATGTTAMACINDEEKAKSGKNIEELNLNITSNTNNNNNLYVRPELILKESLLLGLPFLAHPDMEVSKSAIVLFQAFLRRFNTIHNINTNVSTNNNNNTNNNNMNIAINEWREVIEGIFSGISRKMILPTNYAIEKAKDINQAEEDEYRQDLFSLFKSFVKLFPDVTCKFVGNLIESNINSINNINNNNVVDWTKLEASLKMFYFIGEALNIHTEEMSSIQQFIREILRGVANSFVPTHSNPIIILLWLEICSRYCKFIPSENVFPILEKMVSHGILSPNQTVQSQSCYHFQRSVQQLLSMDFFNKSINRQQLLDKLTPLLALEVTLRFDDRLHLYQAAGYLLAGRSGPSSSGPEPDVLAEPDVASNLVSILGPIMANVKLIVKGNLGEQDTTDNPQVRNFLTCATLAFARMTHGYNKKAVQSSMVTMQCFEEAANLLLEALTQCSDFVELRKAFFSLLHRLVNCVGLPICKILGHALVVILPQSGAQNVIESITLLTQLMNMYKNEQNVGLLMDEVLVPISKTTMNLLKTKQNVNVNVNANINISSSNFLGSNTPLSSSPTKHRPLTLPSRSPNNKNKNERRVEEEEMDNQTADDLTKLYYNLLSALVSCNYAEVLWSPRNRDYFNNIIWSLICGMRGEYSVHFKTVKSAVSVVHLFAGNFFSHPVLGPTMRHVLVQDVAQSFFVVPLKEIIFDIKQDASADLLINQIADTQRLIASLAIQSGLDINWLRQFAANILSLCTVTIDPDSLLRDYGNLMCSNDANTKPQFINLIIQLIKTTRIARGIHK